MPSYRYVVGDVVTDAPLAANQLAVFTDPREIAVATEIGMTTRRQIPTLPLKTYHRPGRRRRDPLGPVYSARRTPSPRRPAPGPNFESPTQSPRPATCDGRTGRTRPLERRGAARRAPHSGREVEAHRPLTQLIGVLPRSRHVDMLEHVVLPGQRLASEPRGIQGPCVPERSRVANDPALRKRQQLRVLPRAAPSFS